METKITFEQAFDEIKKLSETGNIGLENFDDVNENCLFTICKFFSASSADDTKSHLSPWAMSGWRQGGILGENKPSLSIDCRSYVFMGEFDKTMLFPNKTNVERILELIKITWTNDRRPFDWKYFKVMSVAEIKAMNVERKRKF